MGSFFNLKNLVEAKVKADKNRADRIMTLDQCNNCSANAIGKRATPVTLRPS